jgi:hypothetical protein
LDPPKLKKGLKNVPNDFDKATSLIITFPYCK